MLFIWAYFYGNCIIGALYSEFKLDCLLPQPRSAMAARSANGVPTLENESPEKSQAVSFTVDFNDQPPKNPRRMPRQLSSAKTRNRKVSEESIAEKQKKAEERRKVNAFAFERSQICVLIVCSCFL